jgi:hypothetical protein
MLRTIVKGLSTGLAAALIATLAVVALTPHSHKVELVVTWPNTSPASVWRLLTEHAEEPRWLPLFASVERQPDDHGRQVWTYRDPAGSFSATMLTILAVPGRRYERLLLREGQPPNQPWDGRWVFDIEAMDHGTRMRITEYGWTDGFKFFIVQRILGSPHAFLEYYARQMGRALGDPSQIQILRTH